MGSSINSFSLYRFSLPFKKTINFKGNHLTHRQGLWLVHHVAEDKYSTGEISPLSGFSQETLHECEQQSLSLMERINSLSLATLPTKNLLPSVSFAVTCLQHEMPWSNQSLNVNTQNLHSVPLLQGTETEVVERYLQLTCPNHIKLKVARLPIEKEIKLLQTLITINPSIYFRLDANQQWTAQEYAFFLQNIKTQYIDYIEEPTLSLIDNITISEKNKTFIALDESLLKIDEIPISACIKALVIKPTLIGHQHLIAALLKHAQAHQLSVSISACFESPIGLNQLHYLAHQWQQQYQISISLGLDTAQAFDESVITHFANTTHLPTILATQGTCLWKA